MEIRQLKYFVSIAELGSFSEASRRHFLSQSAISQQIKALEEEFKTTLFSRTPHKVILTESGEMLLPLAKQVLQSVGECMDRMSDVNELLCGELTIGVNQAMEDSVRRTMIRFMKIYPKVKLNVFYMNISQMKMLLQKGQLDIAFSIFMDENEDWLECIPVEDIMLHAVMRNTHPLANREELSFKDLERQSLLMPERAMRNHNAVEEYLSKEGYALQVHAVINDPHAIINLLKYSNSVSILPGCVIGGIDELCAIPIKELSRPVKAYAQIPKVTHRKRSVDEFLRIFREETRL